MFKNKVKWFNKKKRSKPVSKEKKQNKLSLENIRERLRTIENSGIINEIYKVCYEIIGKMEENRKNLDSKAGQLNNIIGVCLTIILSTILIIAPIQAGKLTFTLYAITLLLLFVAFFQAMRSMAPRTDYRTISDKDIFNLEVLKEENSNHYKKYMASHYWRVYSKNYRINEEKGAFLKCAYRLFFIALVSFFFAVIRTFFKL